MNDHTCRHCHHPQSQHEVTLYGVVCRGKFWVQTDDEGADKPCQCGWFEE